MNTIKHLASITLTVIIVLSLFLLADILFVGAISMLSHMLGNVEAYYMFKWGVVVLLIVETIITVPIAIEKCNKRR